MPNLALVYTEIKLKTENKRKVFSAEPFYMEYIQRSVLFRLIYRNISFYITHISSNPMSESKHSSIDGARMGSNRENL